MKGVNSWRETTRIWRARAALSAAEAASRGPWPVASRTSSTRPSRRGSSPGPGSMMTRGAVLGFFNEIVTEIGVPEVEERLMAAIEKELELTGLIAARAGAEMADPTQA